MIRWWGSGPVEVLRMLRPWVHDCVMFRGASLQSQLDESWELLRGEYAELFWGRIFLLRPAPSDIWHLFAVTMHSPGVLTELQTTDLDEAKAIAYAALLMECPND